MPRQLTLALWVSLASTVPAFAQQLVPTWFTQEQDKRPQARAEHAASYDSDRDVVVVTGGYRWAQKGETKQLEISESGACFVSQVVEWDGKRWWTIADVPGALARMEHATAYHQARKELILFGGRGAGGIHGDTWSYAESSWGRRADKGKTPEPRSGHAMVYDAERKVVILFGGYAAAKYSKKGKLKKERKRLDDTWAWDGQWKRLRPSKRPTPRSDHAMAYDSLRKRVVLFGGKGKRKKRDKHESTLGDTWEWDGEAWQEMKLPKGSRESAGWFMLNVEGRKEHVLAFDPKRKTSALWGGFKFRPMRLVARYGEPRPKATKPQENHCDTFEWSGTGWARGPNGKSENPVGATGATLTRAPKDGGLLLFGGFYQAKTKGEVLNYLSNDLYVYRLGAKKEVKKRKKRQPLK